MTIAFFTENCLGWVIIVVVLIYVIYLSITRQWTKVREFAYQVMLVAERMLSDEDGKLKFDFVVGLVSNYLPAWLRPFIPRNKLQELIQSWYETAKDFMDDGEINDSIKKVKGG